MSRSRLRYLRLALLVVAGACSGRSAESRGGSVDRARWIDETSDLQIAESSELFLGSLVYAARGPQGRTFLSDVEHARVLSVSESGQLSTLFGRRGSGPGEFQAGEAISMLAGDSILGVVEGRTRRLYVFNLRSDSIIRTLKLPWPSIGSSWNVDGDSVAVALTASSQVLLVGNWRTGQLRAMGNSSPRIKSDMFTVLQHGRPEIVRTSKGILAVFAAEDGAHVIGTAGERLAFVPLPATKRRGIPTALFSEAAKRQRDRDHPKAIEPVGSMIMGLHRLENGHVVVVFMDIDQLERATPDAPVRGLYGNYRLFLTLLAPDLTAACVDAEIQLHTDIVPIPFFRADSMFVIEKAVLSNDTVQTRIRSFTMKPTLCEFSPIGAIGPAMAAR